MKPPTSDKPIERAAPGSEPPGCILERNSEPERTGELEHISGPLRRVLVRLARAGGLSI